MTPEALFWSAVGLLLVGLGLERWQARRKRQQQARVRPQLVREPAPLEEPKVLGRIRRT